MKNGIRLTERDKKVISFLEIFGAADTLQLEKLFFPNAYLARRNLRELADYQEITGISREKCRYTGRYIYYDISKPGQLYHKQLVTEFYLQLRSGPGTVLEYNPRYTLETGKRPDAFVAYQVGNNVHLFFLEVQISSNRLNLEKYIELKPKWKLKQFPKIVVVSNRHFKPKDGLKIYRLNTDYENWQEILT